jgi:hypothetical protein
MPSGFRRNPIKPIDRGAPASVIANKFGGTVAFANALGRNPSTVHGWIVKGFIPPELNAAVMKAAAEAEPKVKLKPLDFVDTRTDDEKAEATAQANVAR